MSFREIIEQCEEVETLERLFSIERYVWLSLSHDMVAVLDMDGCITDVNSHWERAAGYPPVDLQGNYLLEFMHFEDREKNLACLQQLITSDISTLNMDFRFLCRDGTYKRTQWNVAFSPYHDRYFCVVKDVSAHGPDNPLHAAYHDALTGLPNRLFMADHFPAALDAARARQTRAALLFLDLDFFKDANDAFGHRFGDELLKEVARRLRETVRGEDRVIRLGGDEFVALLPKVRDAAQTELVCKRIIEAINAPYCIEGTDVNLGVSVGASIFPDHGDTLEELLEKADGSMYHAKRQGKNGFYVFSG